MKELECPKCTSNLAFITFLRAGTPWSIICKNCNSKMKININMFLLFFLVFVVVAGVMIGLLILNTGIIYNVISLAIAMVIFEYVLYIILGKLSEPLVLRKSK